VVKFVKVIQEKMYRLFFPDTVYIRLRDVDILQGSNDPQMFKCIP